MKYKMLMRYRDVDMVHDKVRKKYVRQTRRVGWVLADKMDEPESFDWVGKEDDDDILEIMSKLKGWELVCFKPGCSNIAIMRRKK